MNKRRSRQDRKENIFWVSHSFKEAENKEKAYWFSQDPIFRIQHIEVLRKLNYGKESSKRLQRVFEVTKRA